MDNAVVLANSPASGQVVGFATRLQAMPMKSKLSALIGIAALAGVVYAMTLWSSQGDFKVLYANLADKDGGAVIAQLSQMNVPYRMSEGGTAILVPAAQVHDLRLKMATAGLPKGTVNGYELMDNARFGQTQFQERLTFQRGLEGELTRSIGSLAAVQSARVHLALPNQNGFFREQQKPSASVLLGLHPGRTLDRAQIAGIVHLVSSSVPEMNPKAVSVLDQSGALLTGGDTSSPNAGLDAQQLQYINQIEQGYVKRIVELIAPVVGPANLRASVTADVDFSQTEATSEEFKPNQGAEASVAIRSQQTTDQGAGGGAGARFAVLQCNDPAWVFESVCMKYLQYACLQVLAYLRGVDNDVDDAMRYSNLAVATNAELVEHVLPFYFASPGHRSSLLLARHFHETYLAAHLEAQNDQIAAIKCTHSESIASTLYGALLLLRACKLLADASTTFYDDLADNYKKVIAHSRCCAHFLLASTFWLAYKQDVAITLADSPTPLFVDTASTSSIDNRCLAMNAFYCIRSALVQTPVVPAAMSAFYSEVALDLSSNYCIGTPPHPLSSGNASENDSIVIYGRIADDVAHAQVQIMHAYTPYIDIGQDKRFTVSMCALEEFQ